MNITLTTIRKNEFLDACVREGYSSPLKRSQIKAIKAKYRLSMPLWIVQDDSRRITHGLYCVPEILEYIKESLMTTPMTAPIVQLTRTTHAVAAAAPVMELARQVETLEQDIENLIPQSIATYVPYGAYKDIEKVIKSTRFYPMYITGLSGNGKTTMVQQICATNNREFVRANITKETDEDDLLGGFRLLNGESVWVDGPAVVAMKRGAILLLDEVDLNPDKIMCLQPVMEGNPIFLKKINRYVYPVKGFNILATANTKGQGGEESVKFIGTSIMNEAFLERFAITIEHEYPTRAVEKKIVMNMMKREECVEESFADNLVRWAETIRKTYYEGACDDIITTRRLEHIVVAFGIFKDRLDAVKKGVARFNKITKDSFIDLYTKLDADVGAPVDSTVAPTTIALDVLLDGTRVDLKVAYADREGAKVLGAKWDATNRVWFTDGKNYKIFHAEFAQYTPSVSTSIIVNDAIVSEGYHSSETETNYAVTA